MLSFWMMRFWLRLILMLIVTLAVTSLMARALGRTQPPRPALQAFTEDCEGKPQPCWNGIVPDETTLTQVQQWLDAKNYERIDNRADSVSFSNRNQATSTTDTCSIVTLTYDRKMLIVKSIVLTGCSGIVLGDLAFIGCPKADGQAGVKAHQYLLAEVTQRVHLDKNKHHIWTPTIRLDSLTIGTNLDSAGGLSFIGDTACPTSTTNGMHT